MPYKEHEIEKLYWTIGEAAEILGVAESFIRFYDVELKLNIYRDSRRKSRRLTAEDMQTMRIIIALSKYCHMAGIKKIYKQNKLEQIGEILK